MIDSKVAVAGMGAVTPLGNSVGSTWAALIRGESGVAPITRFDASRYPVSFAAEVADAGNGPDLYSRLLASAADEALRNTDLAGIPPRRIGVFMGSEAIRPDLTDLARSVLDNQWMSEEAVRAHLPMRAALQLAERLGARGPVVTLSTACTSSGQAVGEAILAIRRGEVDVAVAGGVDVLVHPLMVTGFARLGALSTKNHSPSEACRPFDIDRDGFVLGEGCGLVVLVSSQVLNQVGEPLGWLSGYGCSSNAWRITDSPPDGRGASAAIQQALLDAGKTPEDVVYINAHGTGTLQNDISEARGIRAALGDAADRVAVSSTKSMTGHLVGACGVVETLISLMALRERLAPPTINLDNPDPDCPISHVPWTPKPLGPGVALTNAFGFGGSNATIVVEAP